MAWWLQQGFLLFATQQPKRAGNMLAEPSLSRPSVPKGQAFQASPRLGTIDETLIFKQKILGLTLLML